MQSAQHSCAARLHVYELTAMIKQVTQKQYTVDTRNRACLLCKQCLSVTPFAGVLGSCPHLAHTEHAALRSLGHLDQSWH